MDIKNIKLTDINKLSKAFLHDNNYNIKMIMIGSFKNIKFILAGEVHRNYDDNSLHPITRIITRIKNVSLLLEVARDTVFRASKSRLLSKRKKEVKSKNIINHLYVKAIEHGVEVLSCDPRSSVFRALCYRKGLLKITRNRIAMSAFCDTRDGALTLLSTMSKSQAVQEAINQYDYR